MNALILTAEAAKALIAKQDGQHQLAPVALTDGRYFLMADVLEEPLYAGKLNGVQYEIKALSNISNLMPKSTEDE